MCHATGRAPRTGGVVRYAARSIQHARFGRADACVADAALALIVGRALAAGAVHAADPPARRALVIRRAFQASNLSVTSARAADQVVVVSGAVADERGIAAAAGSFAHRTCDGDAGLRCSLKAAIDIAERERLIAAQAVLARAWIWGRATDHHQPHQREAVTHEQIFPTRKQLSILRARAPAA